MTKNLKFFPTINQLLMKKVSKNNKKCPDFSEHFSYFCKFPQSSLVLWFVVTGCFYHIVHVLVRVGHNVRVRHIVCRFDISSDAAIGGFLRNLVDVGVVVHLPYVEFCYQTVRVQTHVSVLVGAQRHNGTFRSLDHLCDFIVEYAVLEHWHKTLDLYVECYLVLFLRVHLEVYRSFLTVVRRQGV